MARRTIVVVGGALGGPTAAARAREMDEKARIVLIERSRHVNYAVCGLAYRASREVRSLEAANRERARFFSDVYRVEVRTRVAAVGLDARAHRVQLSDGRMAYDSLVYAAGAESIAPELPGFAGAANVFRFRTPADLDGILARLRRGKRRVVILGGGFIGVEAADGLRRRGCSVTLLERRPRVLSSFSPQMSGAAAIALERAGVRLLLDEEAVLGRRAGADVDVVELRGGRRLDADVVILAAGLRPRTGLLREAGARLTPQGAAVVDDRCATSLPDVFACGVCVSLRHAVSGRRVWLAQAAIADKTGQVAGACAAGADARMSPALGTALVRAGSLTLGRTGLTLEEAAAYAGSELDSVVVHAPSRDAFFPGAAAVSLEIFYHRGSGRLLGAEVASSNGADKRLDVLATAILSGLTVEQLGLLDLGYAPPYSAARDATNVAGCVAAAARASLASPWSVSRVRAMGRKLTIVDVRVVAASREGSLPGALKLPLRRLRQHMHGLPTGRPLVFVCADGREAYLAARIARGAGRKDAGFLSGGLTSWKNEGQALV